MSSNSKDHKCIQIKTGLHAGLHRALLGSQVSADAFLCSGSKKNDCFDKLLNSTHPQVDNRKVKFEKSTLCKDFNSLVVGLDGRRLNLDKVEESEHDKRIQVAYKLVMTRLKEKLEKVGFCIPEFSTQKI